MHSPIGIVHIRISGKALLPMLSLSTIELHNTVVGIENWNIWLSGSEKQLYNNFSFTYWPYIYWYEAISDINPIKHPKCTLQLKLSNFKIFANCKVFV